MNDHDSDVARIELIADLFVSEYRRGLFPTVEEFAARYPQEAGRLSEILPALCLMEKARFRASSTPASRSAWGPADLPSHQSLGDFEIRREVGRGGMGIVYEARQRSLDRVVALKVLLPHIAADARSSSRFEREAKAAARLHHTNIVQVFGVGSHDGIRFYAMQFIDGPGLNQVIRALRHRARGTTIGGETSSEDATLDPRAIAIARALTERDLDSLSPDPTADVPVGKGAACEGGAAEATGSSQATATRRESKEASLHADRYLHNVARLGMEAAEALSYAHQSGVTHRDIKPSNLLINSQCAIWITDFGLAKVSDSDEITRTGDVVGTLRYLPPEAFAGESDARSDIYALGLTLYELLTLEPAYPGDDRAQVVKMITTKDPQDIRRRVPGIPRDLATIIHKAIEREPRRRYQSSAELYEDLKRFRLDEPILARRTTVFERLTRWSRRNRELATALAGVLTLMILISVSAVFAALYFRDQEGIQHTLHNNAEQFANHNRRLLEENQKALAKTRKSESELRVARTRAELLEEKTRRNLYTTQMIQAHQSFGQHRGLGRAQALLDAWRPSTGERDFRDWEWYFINALCQRESLALSGHENAVTGVDWSPDGLRLASVGRDGTVRIWDASSRAELARWDVSPPCYCVAWDHSGDRLAVGGEKALFLWNVETGERLLELPQTRAVYALSWTHDNSALAAALKESRGVPGSIMVIGSEAGEVRQEFEVAAVGTYNTTISWSADDRLLAAPDARSVRVWNLEEERFVHRLKPLTEGVQAVAFHPSDSASLAVAGRDAVIRVWDLETEAQIATLSGHTHSIASIAWSPDGTLLASAGWDGTARVWNVTARSEVVNWAAHPRHCFSVRWHPDGRRLASGGDDNLVKVWHLNSSLEFREIEGSSEEAITGLCFNDSSQTIRARSAAGQVWAWDASSGEKSFQSPAGRSAVASCFDPQGQLLTCAFADGTVEQYELPTRRLTQSLSTSLQSISRIACRYDGAVVAIADRNGVVSTWDIVAKTKIASSEKDSAPVWSMSWDLGGKQLAVGDELGRVRLWNTAEVDLAPMALSGHQFGVSELAWSPDGKSLATASVDHIVRVWQLHNDADSLVLKGHNENVQSVSWSPDGRRLLSGDARGTLIVWDPSTGQATLELRGRRGQLHAACWSHDGRQIAASTDGHIMIWDATKGFRGEGLIGAE